ncbi:MAG: rod shape-determining protein RodA [Pseudoxanthomonas sp.]|nr:rod shape-determining protein RodA [Pseudoxanthomonas sp.]
MRGGLDPWLLGGLLLLAAAGLAILYGASGGNGDLVLRQGARFGLGLVLMLVAARLPPGLLLGWTPWLYGGAVLLLVLVALLGEGRGAHRWLDLGVVRFQPSEITKLALPMMLAWVLHGQPLPPRWPVLALLAALVALPSLLIGQQPDLGTALLVAASGLFVVFLAGLPWRWMLAAGTGAAAAAPVLWHFMHEYQRNRVRTFLDPESDPLGQGWNIIQSKIAVGSGGLHGKGWMAGTQSQLDFLPEHTTDFVFAVFAEEFGFVGVLAMLALYGFIIGRTLVIAGAARHTYGRLLAGSIALTFGVYVLINGAMVAGLLPVVGVPMPLVSYGGTSAVTLLLAFGLVFSVHRHRRQSSPGAGL